MKMIRTTAFSTMALVAAFGASTVQAQYSVTVLHHNDGENAFFENGDGFGGIGNFVTTINGLRAGASTPDVISLSAGDQILPGTALSASLTNGSPLWPAIGQYAAGFDAMVLGNHEFDLGTAVTADYISSFGSVPATSTPGGFANPAGSAPVFVNTNLDFSADPNLAPLLGTSIFSSAVINSGTKNIGILGVTTPSLSSVSSPGPGVSLVAPGTNPSDSSPAIAAGQLAGIINTAAADLLNNQGADNVFLVGHLQGIGFDSLVAGSLTDIDAIIAAGGGELMADAGGHDLIPGDAPNTATVYGSSVNGIPIVTTPGGYNYVGQLVLNFNADGSFAGVDTASSGLKAVDGNVVAADPFTVEEVEDPITAALAGGNVVIATSEVALDSRRSNGLSPLAGGQGERIAETNLGNLIADAIVDRVLDENVEFSLGINETVIGIMNGGGIRQDAFGNDDIIPAGDITQLVIDNNLPFNNGVGYIEGVTVSRLLDVLENAVSNVEGVDGRFAQVSGFKFVYDLDAAPGDRVVEIRLKDGTLLFDEDFTSSETFTLAIFDFLAGGGDDYPLDDLVFNALDLGENADQQVLTEFIINDLGGVITAADYPEGGEGRITVIPEPTSLALLAVGALMVARRRRA